MSRVIKFRAWNGKDKVIEEISDLYWFEENGVHDFGGEGHHGDYVFLQFTGLHDKNGVEIYEGDVVKCHFISLMDPDMNGSLQEVKYDPAFGFTPIHDIVDYNGATSEGKDWEVIGSIYENPELLK